MFIKFVIWSCGSMKIFLLNVKASYLIKIYTKQSRLWRVMVWPYYQFWLLWSFQRCFFKFFAQKDCSLRKLSLHYKYLCSPISSLHQSNKHQALNPFPFLTLTARSNGTPSLVLSKEREAFAEERSDQSSDNWKLGSITRPKIILEWERTQ